MTSWTRPRPRASSEAQERVVRERVVLLVADGETEDLGQRSARTRVAIMIAGETMRGSIRAWSRRRFEEQMGTACSARPSCRGTNPTSAPRSGRDPVHPYLWKHAVSARGAFDQVVDLVGRDAAERSPLSSTTANRALVDSNGAALPS